MVQPFTKTGPSLVAVEAIQWCYWRSPLDQYLQYIQHTSQIFSLGKISLTGQSLSCFQTLELWAQVDKAQLVSLPEEIDPHCSVLVATENSEITNLHKKQRHFDSYRLVVSLVQFSAFLLYLCTIVVLLFDLC